jgi:hypothetical protein
VIVIEELEQLLFDFGIPLMARRRWAAVFAGTIGRLGQRRNC